MVELHCSSSGYILMELRYQDVFKWNRVIKVCCGDVGSSGCILVEQGHWGVLW